MAKPPAKRARLAPEEAKARILDAAERRLAEGGPDALRLADIARDLEISHPAILHHFGSRDGLVTALETRAMSRLRDDLLTHVEASAGEGFARVFATLGDAGHARLLAWQILRKGSLGVRDDAAMLKTLADAYHETRVNEALGNGAPTPEYADTVHWVRLAALALFAEALIGPLLTESARLGDADTTHAGFQAWLGALFDRQS